MDTVMGVKWPLPSPGQLMIILFIVLAGIAVYFFLQYRKHLNDKKIHDYSLFLFKAKRLGLSNFQIKSLNNIIEILHLQNPTMIFDTPELFEKAVSKFLDFVKAQHEEEESFASICKDLTITYERLYHPAHFKKALESLDELETDHLLYFMTEKGNVFFGKITDRRIHEISIRLFRSARELEELRKKGRIKVYVWRVGDAEYTFDSETIELTGNVLSITLPEEFIRDQEFRHPYIDCIIPATLSRTDLRPSENFVPVHGTIYKLNDFEVVMRISEKLGYMHSYNLAFTLNDFKFNIISRIISNRTISEGSAFYYTIKFDEISDAARTVLKKYITEQF